MAHAAALPPAVTIGAFDAFLDDRRDESRWEFVDGALVAMTDRSFNHAGIIGNVAVALRSGLTRASDRLSFPALMFAMPLSDVYAGVELPSA